VIKLLGVAQLPATLRIYLRHTLDHQPRGEPGLDVVPSDLVEEGSVVIFVPPRVEVHSHNRHPRAGVHLFRLGKLAAVQRRDAIENALFCVMKELRHCFNRVSDEQLAIEPRV